MRLAVFMLLLIASVSRCYAQDRPPPGELKQIIPHLDKKPIMRVDYVPARGPGEATGAACGMQKFTMTLRNAAIGKSSPAIRLLADPQSGATSPKTLLITLDRIKVDSDGSPRTYHPVDISAQRRCDMLTNPITGICPLDRLVNSGPRTFIGPRADDAGFAENWKAIWPSIQDGSLKPVWIKDVAGADKIQDGYYFYYLRNKRISAFLKDAIIPQQDGKPCVHGPGDRYPGYFQSATKLENPGHDAARCAAARYLDAEQVPYFVFPGAQLGEARMGDVVVGIYGERTVFGIAGDEGSVTAFGEASIAFNQVLLNRPARPGNVNDADGLEVVAIWRSAGKTKIKPLAILVFAGTRALLKETFTAENIGKVGQQKFDEWKKQGSDAEKRLAACVADLGPPTR